jgi:hypothetical protein
MTVLAWILFGIPLGTSILGLKKFRSRSPAEGESLVPLRRVGYSLLLAMAAALLGIGQLAYAKLVEPIPPRNYTVEVLGLAIAFAGLVCALSSRGSGRFEISGILALVASLWLCVLYFLMGSTY